MRIFTVLCLIGFAAACQANGSEGEGSSSPTTPMLFSLTREGVPPSADLIVFVNGDWSLVSQDACRGTKGSLAQDEVSTLQGYIQNPDLDTVASNCDDATSFKLAIDRRDGPTKFVCWDDKAKDTVPAIKALTAFFEDRVSDLKWDGQVVKCDNRPPTSENFVGDGPDPSPENMPAPRMP